jgi:hypothetical protein
MGAHNSRVEGICRPAQSGKTKTYQELIKEYELLADLFYDCEGFINVVLCSNNKSLVQQTTARHAADLYESGSVESDGGAADDRIEGKVFSWFSGTKENNLSVRDLADRIKEDEVGMVVCCAHSTRIQFLEQLLQQLNRSKNFKKRVNIWIDEADESIKKWSKIDISGLEVVHSVTLISATFDAIVKKYGKVRVRCYDVAHPASYVGFKDCAVTSKDIAAASALSYMEQVYAEIGAQLCVPGMRLFAPGDITQESHRQIADFLRERGWAVLVLNGARKEIVKPDGQVLPIADYIEWENGTPEEIGKTITSIYHDSGLAAFPFAITGQICLGRGLTFQNDRFLFDWAIVPNMTDRATAYQCAARVLGNIRHLQNYKQCKIITTSRMRRLIEQAENIAINIGRGVKGYHAVVDKAALKRAQVGAGVDEETEDAATLDYGLSPTFATSTAAKQWCKRNLDYGCSVYGIYGPDGKKPGSGYIKYRGALRPLLAEADLRGDPRATGANAPAPASWFRSLDGAGGLARVMPVVDIQAAIAGSSRVMPVIADKDIGWIAIYKKSKLLTPSE